MKLLNGENKYHIKVPSIFVTNGEENQNNNVLMIYQEIKLYNHFQRTNHSRAYSMKDLVDVYKNVLVVGGVGNVCRNVAESYGFKNVYTPLDIMKWNPAVSPYHDLTEEERVCTKDVDFHKIPIDAIMVFADSRNY